jgi:hypothetical protein
MDNLRKTAHHSDRLVLYVQKEWETPDHLLLHCDIARDLWNLVFRMFGVEWVMPRRVVELLACWKRRFSQNDLNVVWNVIPSCLMWCIWRERNARSFEEL